MEEKDVLAPVEKLLDGTHDELASVYGDNDADVVASREAVRLLLDVADRADKTCGGWTEVLVLREFGRQLEADRA